jgi:cytochrome c5
VKLIAEIKAVPTYELEMKGGELFAAAAAKADAEDYIAAVNAYKDVMKKTEGSKIAGVAKEQAEKLISKGMPGFETSCEKCHKAKKACEKHAKPMKL